MMFDTPASFGISSKTFFFVFVTLSGLALFVCVFLCFGEQVFKGQKLSLDDDESTVVTRDTDGSITSKTVLSRYSNVNDDQTVDDTTYSTYTNDTSTVQTSAQEPQSSTGEKLAKLRRIGDVIVERLIYGKPQRTEQHQPQAQGNDVMEDDSITITSDAYTLKAGTITSAAGSYSYTMKAGTTELGASKKQDAVQDDEGQEYRQLEEEDCIELIVASSSCSSTALNCDSMDVQAFSRISPTKQMRRANEEHEDNKKRNHVLEDDSITIASEAYTLKAGTITSETGSYSYTIKAGAVESDASKKQDVVQDNEGQEYRQFEEEKSTELIDAPSSCSSTDLSCDSMDVQAFSRISPTKQMRRANEEHKDNITPHATAHLYAFHAAAEKLQLFGKGFVDKAVADAHWLLNDDESVRPAEDTRDAKDDFSTDYQQMSDGNNFMTLQNDVLPYDSRSVSTLFHGVEPRHSGNVIRGLPMSYFPNDDSSSSRGNYLQQSGKVVKGIPVSYHSSGDSSRDDADPDDSSMVPAVPRKQAVMFDNGTNYRHKERFKGIITHSDSISVSPVKHGNDIHGDRKQTKAGRDIMAKEPSCTGKSKLRGHAMVDLWQHH